MLFFVQQLIRSTAAPSSFSLVSTATLTSNSAVFSLQPTVTRMNTACVCARQNRLERCKMSLYFKHTVIVHVQIKKQIHISTEKSTDSDWTRRPRFQHREDACRCSTVSVGQQFYTSSSFPLESTGGGQKTQQVKVGNKPFSSLKKRTIFQVYLGKLP